MKKNCRNKGLVIFDADKKEKFLKYVRTKGNFSAACDHVAITMTTAYNHRDSDPEFAKAWVEAKEKYIDWLESVADERATRADKPSDLLMIFRLKGERPQKYKENVNLTGKVDLFSGIEIEKLIDIAKRGCNTGGDTGGSE
jgi:hypothetical protein